MNKCLRQSLRRLLGGRERFTGLSAGLALVVIATGCANHRPAPIAVTPGQTTSSATCSGNYPHLKLVTYNILGLPSFMTGADSRRYPRIRAELERLDPDVILLQEAWTAKARKAAPAGGPWSIARGEGQRTFFQQNGLVTLTKFPVLGGEFYPFGHEAFPDKFVNKGVLKVTVQLRDGLVLNVWNVHLQQRGSEQIRRAQARELVARVQAAEDGQIADIVGGDFNFTPGSPLHLELEKSLGPSVLKLGGGEPFVTWRSTQGESQEGKMLDYVFIRGRVAFQDLQANQRAVLAASMPSRQLSDHLGVEARMSLEPATALAGAVNPALRESSWPETDASRSTLGGGN